MYSRLNPPPPPASSRGIRYGGIEVSGWIVDWEIQLRLTTKYHRVDDLWCQGGFRRLWTSRAPFHGRLGTYKTSDCPCSRCPSRCLIFMNVCSCIRRNNLADSSLKRYCFEQEKAISIGVDCAVYLKAILWLRFVGFGLIIRGNYNKSTMFSSEKK